MNRTLLLSTLLLCLITLVRTEASGQVTQYSIGGPGNHIATKLCFDPSDGSTIISGYSYEFNFLNAYNCQALLLKVSKAGDIVWQKTFGIPGTNNLIQDMILTQDGNIVVVGKVGGTSTNVFADNTAAILKFNSQDGSLIWQKCFRDATTTTGGELLFGVTEISGGRLLAVGAYNFTGVGSASMITVFESDGAFAYTELYDIISGDAFQGVTASADGNSVYICGNFVGNYKDVRVMKYIPGATSGTVAWSTNMDYFPNGNLENNSLARIYRSGNKLVVSGSSIQAWSFAGGTSHNVVILNESDGGDPKLYALKNSDAKYANSPAIAVVSPNHIFTVQSPATSYYDPMLSTVGTSTGTVITEITDLQNHSANTPVKFVALNGAQQSINDFHLHDNTLRLVGSTNNLSSGSFNNEIYYVITDAAMTTQQCDTTHESISITNIPYWSAGASYTKLSFTPTFVTVDTGSVQLDIQIMCADFPASVAGVTSKGNLSIYPNPTSGMVTIKGATPLRQVSISNVMGQVLHSSSPERSVTTINIERLSAGVYFISVDGKSYKLIKH